MTIKTKLSSLSAYAVFSALAIFQEVYYVSKACRKWTMGSFNQRTGYFNFTRCNEQAVLMRICQSNNHKGI